MKNYILFALALLLACKTQQKSTSIERPEFEIIPTRDFEFLETGASLDLGGITITKLDGERAALTRPVKEVKAIGRPARAIDRSRTEVNIGSKNREVDRSRQVDRSRGDVDRSRQIDRTRIRSPSAISTVLRYLPFLIVLVSILYFAPKIKNLLKIFK